MDKDHSLATIVKANSNFHHYDGGLGSLRKIKDTNTEFLKGKSHSHHRILWHIVFSLQHYGYCNQEYQGEV